MFTIWLTGSIQTLLRFNSNSNINDILIFYTYKLWEDQNFYNWVFHKLYIYNIHELSKDYCYVRLWIYKSVTLLSYLFFLFMFQKNTDQIMYSFTQIFYKSQTINQNKYN